MITRLKPNERFVFGSNTSGRHGKGAALFARKNFGAEYGVGEGITGRCYAFPTLDHNFLRRSLGQLEMARNRLYTYCREHPEEKLLLTKVGCGLAGYQEEFMRDLFCYPPDNLILPEDWQ